MAQRLNSGALRKVRRNIRKTGANVPQMSTIVVDFDYERLGRETMQVLEDPTESDPVLYDHRGTAYTYQRRQIGFHSGDFENE